MPRETYSTARKRIAMDDLAQTRAIAAVEPVQKSYSAYEFKVYGANDSPPVDAAYVRTHAITVGLNRWGRAGVGPHAPTISTFALQDGSGVAAIEVDVLDTDVARAQRRADALSIDVDIVLSAALCTGVAVLAGDKRANVPGPTPAFGPFVVPPS